MVEYAKPIVPYEENTEDELNKLLELGFGEVVVEVNNNQVPLLPGAVAESVHTNYIAAGGYKYHYHYSSLGKTKAGWSLSYYILKLCIGRTIQSMCFKSASGRAGWALELTE